MSRERGELAHSWTMREIPVPAAVYGEIDSA